MFLLLFLRSCAAGLRYWPQLDDYIQYHNYASSESFAALQESVGILASRPLAGIADFFIWSPLFSNLLVGVAVISALYAVTVMGMKCVLGRYMRVGPIFPVVMALLPLGVEGTYWVSASSRIVVGLFFAWLAAACFGRWLDEGGWGRGVLFALAMLIPFGFYEQPAILAMALVLGMAALEWRNRGRRALLAVWVIPAALLYFQVTALLSHGGVYGSRAEIVLPTSIYYWKTFFPEIIRQISAVFLKGSVYTTFKGFVRGVQLIGSEGLYLWLAAVMLLCIAYTRMAGRCATEDRKPPGILLPLAAGVLLTLAPLSLFLLLANPWFSMRNAVPSFVGIALLCDVILCSISRGASRKRGRVAALAGAMALVFSISGVSEIWDYRSTWENDQMVATALLTRLQGDAPELDEGSRVGILNLEPSYLADQNFQWHEHIHGCTESSWALTGLLTALDFAGTLPEIVPLPTDPMYRKWNAETNRPDGFDLLYYYQDGTVEVAVLQRTGTHAFQVYTTQGTLLGEVWEESDGIGYFRASRDAISEG